MADNETIADIVAEMRARADELESSSYRPPRFLRELIAGLRREADRLEAALKREVATTKESLVVGNAAKLRDAVMYCLGIMKRLDWIGDGVFENGKYINPDTISEAKKIAEAALSAPPRNCDRYAAHEAALDAWLATPKDKYGCFDEWLYAMAEGGAK